MALSVNFGDQFPAGHNIAVTILTPNGPPSAEVRLKDGPPLATKITLLDTHKYKLRFVLPEGAKGEFDVSIQAGADEFSASQKIS